MTVEINITETDLNKMYTDILHEVQDFLKKEEIHDFDTHEPGEKIRKKAKIENTDEIIDLYFLRPQTKNGLWKRLSLARGLKEKLSLEPGSKITFSLKNKILIVGKINATQMSSNVDENEDDFLLQLRNLQQDQKDAISTPRGWKDEPLLYIKGRLDEKFDKLAETTTNHETNEGEWFFLVGSPGNGKSAYCGQYYRKLKDTHRFKFNRKGSDENFSLKDLCETEIPYRIEISKKEETFARCWMIQDASVSKEIYTQDPDPARGLIEELLAAKKKGVSLIVCANRGVVESAYNFLMDNIKYPESTYRDIQKIFKTICEDGSFKSIKIGTENKKAPFSSAKINYEELDAESLLLGENNKGFSELLDKATEIDKWTKCNSCSSAGLCPWHQNRKTLSDEGGKDSLISVLRRAEAYSGQIIVFRAALALISKLLTGHSQEQGKNPPCNWVKKNINDNNFFTLLNMRVYMQLFSSHTPLGLEEDADARDAQVKDLEDLINTVEDSNSNKDLVPFKRITDKQKWPQTSIGLKDLLGKGGHLHVLDPLKASLESNFLEKWSSLESIKTTKSPFVGKIEVKCSEIFGEIQNLIGEHNSSESPKHYRTFKRYLSSFTLRLGAYKEKITAFQDDLELFISALEHKKLKKTEKRNLKEDVTDSLKKAYSIMDDEWIKVTPNFKIKGDEIKANPKWEPNELPSILLKAKIRNLTIPLTGQMFIWLNQISQKNLIEKSLPESILAKLMDSRDRIASTIDYSTIPDIELKITPSEYLEDEITLSRDDDELFI